VVFLYNKHLKNIKNI